MPVITIEITDRELLDKVERCAKERVTCMVVADQSFKYLAHLERLLDQMKGDARHSAFRVISDSWPLKDVLACIGLAQGEPPYDKPLLSWHYEHANGGIVIHFDPA
jgi:hypothetical protein